jgi:hypothetical protein
MRYFAMKISLNFTARYNIKLMKSIGQIAFSLLFIFSFVSCKNNSSNKNSESQKTACTCSGDEFSFDKVEAYSISFEALDAMEAKKNQSDNDRFLLQIVNSFRTNNLKELDSAKLIVLGFTQRQINKEDYKYLCELFQEQYAYEDTTACQAIFRDILLFKENRKLTGVAKICYTCGHSVVMIGDSVREVNVNRLDALLN